MNLVYFILPPSDPSVNKVLQLMRISTLGQEYTFMKAISVTSQLHRGTAKQVCMYALAKTSGLMYVLESSH